MSISIRSVQEHSLIPIEANVPVLYRGPVAEDQMEYAMAKSEYHVPNLERALLMLELLSKHPKGLTQKQIIDQLEVSKNSVYRIAATLTNYGYIRRDPATSLYCLTRKMMIQGCTAMGDQDLVMRAMDVMQKLRDEVNASVLLGVLEGVEGVILSQAVGGCPFKFSVDLGMRFQLHCSAPGKALLAFLPEAECEELLGRIPLTRYNERTLCTRTALRAEFARIRECGYAVDRAEQFEGCHCVGSVVRDHNNYPIAMVWATGPSVNLTEDRFEEVGHAVVEHVARISKRFGHGLA